MAQWRRFPYLTFLLAVESFVSCVSVVVLLTWQHEWVSFRIAGWRVSGWRDKKVRFARKVDDCGSESSWNHRSDTISFHTERQNFRIKFHKLEFHTQHASTRLHVVCHRQVNLRVLSAVMTNPDAIEHRTQPVNSPIARRFFPWKSDVICLLSMKYWSRKTESTEIKGDMPRRELFLPLREKCLISNLKHKRFHVPLPETECVLDHACDHI